MKTVQNQPLDVEVGVILIHMKAYFPNIDIGKFHYMRFGPLTVDRR